MIRLFLIVIVLIIFFILSLILIPLEALIGVFDKKAKANSSLAIIKIVFRIIIFISGTDLTVIGLENVPKDEPVLYVGNHRSFFDIIISMVYVPRVTGYVSKIENSKVPLLSWWMKNIHCLYLDRGDIKQGVQTIVSAIEEVKNGYSICIFPEGTRNKVNDTFLPFHEGSFKIALKSGCPIQPFVFNNAAAIYEDSHHLVKKAKVVLEYLPPIDVKNLDREESKHIGATVQKMIEETYFKNKETYNL